MVGPSVVAEKEVISNWLVLQYFQTHQLYQNGWSFSISRYTGYTKMVGFSVFPDSQVPKMVEFSVFPDLQVLTMTDDPISHYSHIFLFSESYFITRSGGFYYPVINSS